jgi:hypothetical protein
MFHACSAIVATCTTGPSKAEVTKIQSHSTHIIHNNAGNAEDYLLQCRHVDWQLFADVSDDLKEKRRYWKLKEEALDRTQWRTRFGRGYGPEVRQTTE